MKAQTWNRMYGATTKMPTKNDIFMYIMNASVGPVVMNFTAG